MPLQVRAKVHDHRVVAEVGQLGGDWAQVEGDAPTHWMPLPAAPSLSSGAGRSEERG
ncbi:DUF551 domain-containing protein [Rhizobium subbaraonis]|uniref:DUF551 domain-containing protein n=1 Tax=Rhizobium subbaraonis TaxID=908946 RepID=UPI0015970C42